MLKFQDKTEKKIGYKYEAYNFRIPEYIHFLKQNDKYKQIYTSKEKKILKVYSIEPDHCMIECKFYFIMKRDRCIK